MTRLPSFISVAKLEDYCGSSSTASTAMSHPVLAFMGKSMPGSMLKNLGVIWTVGGPELFGPDVYGRLKTAYESRIIAPIIYFYFQHAWCPMRCHWVSPSDYLQCKC